MLDYNLFVLNNGKTLILFVMVKIIKRVKIYVIIALAWALLITIVPTQVARASAQMPFYNLQPKFLTVRSQFYTTYTNSPEERKTNVATAVKSLNNVLVDVGGEFSFNRTVGPRTESRGYKSAKIIVNGKFVDGVGGGVCQVSTTLYNAILLAGLKITEYHPHSLPVSYIAPSFDAMVNSGSADLRFINTTNNPIIIMATADGDRVKISILGEPMKEKYIRQSIITEYIEPPDDLVIPDQLNQYPDLLQGQIMVVQSAKCGCTSQGVLIKTVNGKVVSQTVFRHDKYAPVKRVIVQGMAHNNQNTLKKIAK